MKKMTKWTIGAAVAGVMALGAMAPAEAGVTIGLGVPLVDPARGANWCYYHPGACGPAYVRTPVVGVFVPSRGYWDGHGWYLHRYWGRGHWHYR